MKIKNHEEERGYIEGGIGRKGKKERYMDIYEDLHIRVKRR